MERLFLDTNRNLIRLSQKEFEQAKEIGDLIQYCYNNRDEIKCGGGAVEQMTKRASCIIRDRDNIKALVKIMFDGVVETPKMAQYHPLMASNMIENTKVTAKIPNPKQTLKDQLLASIRDVERFVKANINSQKSKIVAQTIGIVSLIAHLYNKNLVDGEIIFNWILNVLVSGENVYVRHTMLAIIREKIKKLVESGRADIVTVAVDKIIREEGFYECEGKLKEKVVDEDESEWMEVESLASIDEGDGFFIDYIEWFKQEFTDEIPSIDILSYRKYPKHKKQRFAKALAKIIDSNFELIPKLARFFEQFVRNIDGNFRKDFFAAVEVLKEEETKISFLFAIDKFHAELCILDVEMVDVFMRSSLEWQTNQSDQLDICFLLNFMKLGDKLRKTDRKLYRECLNYVNALYKMSISGNLNENFDLFNLEEISNENINQGFENMVMQVINNVETLDMHFILSNPALHAKYIFVKSLEHIEKRKSFAKAIHALGQHPHHKSIKPMIAALCDEYFERENNVPFNNENDNLGNSNLLNLIAELFNVGVVESKSVINMLSILSENNSIDGIYSFAMITKEKVEENNDPDFEVFKEFLLDVTVQSEEDIKAIKGKPPSDLKPEQKFVLYLQRIINGANIKDFDKSIVKNSESLAHIAKVLSSRTTHSPKLLENFSAIFKTVQSYSSDFENAFCYTVMIRATALIKNVSKRRNLCIKENWKHVLNTGKMIAILYKENIIDNLHRMLFKLLMEIKQECKGEDDVDHEGLCVMIKLFTEVAGKYKKEQFEIFLQIMDIIYEIKESQKVSRNLRQLLKLRRDILDDFEALTPIDDECGSVNPSMRYVISLMTNLRPYDHVQYFADVVNAKEAANCFFHHALKHFYNTKDFVEFLIVWSKIEMKTKERSRFLPEIVNLCMRSFIVEHVQKVRSTNPVRTIVVAKFIAKLFLVSIIKEQIYVKFIEMIADDTVFNLTDLNFRCLEAILRAAEFKRLKNCEKYFKLRNLILDRKNKIFRSEIDDQNFKAESEIYNPKRKLSLDQPKLCLEILFDDVIYRVKAENFPRVQENFRACCTFQGLHRNFKTIFEKKANEYIFMVTEVPQVKSLDWNKLAILTVFIGFCHSYMNNTDSRGELFEKLVKNLHETKSIHFTQFFLSVVKPLGFPPGSFYVTVVDEMFVKAEIQPEETRKAIKEILSIFDNSMKLKAKNDEVSPSLKALVNGIVTQNDYSDVLTINNIKVAAKFYFDNAIFYPFSHLESFVSQLTIANEIAKNLKGGERRLCSELWKIIVDLVSLCEENFFKFDLRRDVGVTKLATLMYTSQFYPPDKYFQFIDKVLHAVSIHATHVTLLRYANSVCILTPEMMGKYPNFRNYNMIRNHSIPPRRLKSKTEAYKTDEDLDGPVPEISFEDSMVLAQTGKRILDDPNYQVNNPQYMMLMQKRAKEMLRDVEKGILAAERNFPQQRKRDVAGSRGAVPKNNSKSNEKEVVSEPKGKQDKDKKKESPKSTKTTDDDGKKKKNRQKGSNSNNGARENDVHSQNDSKISENTNNIKSEGNDLGNTACDPQSNVKKSKNGNDIQNGSKCSKNGSHGTKSQRKKDRNRINSQNGFEGNANVSQKGTTNVRSESFGHNKNRRESGSSNRSQSNTKEDENMDICTQTELKKSQKNNCLKATKNTSGDLHSDDNMNKKDAHFPNNNKLISNKQSISGTFRKQFPCIECSLDTRDFVSILCNECKKSTHIDCMKYERFDEQGNYKCTKCSSPTETSKCVNQNSTSLAARKPEAFYNPKLDVYQNDNEVFAFKTIHQLMNYEAFKGVDTPSLFREIISSSGLLNFMTNWCEEFHIGETSNKPSNELDSEPCTNNLTLQENPLGHLAVNNMRNPICFKVNFDFKFKLNPPNDSHKLFIIECMFYNESQLTEKLQEMNFEDKLTIAKILVDEIVDGRVNFQVIKYLSLSDESEEFINGLLTYIGVWCQELLRVRTLELEKAIKAEEKLNIQTIKSKNYAKNKRRRNKLKAAKKEVSNECSKYVPKNLVIVFELLTSILVLRFDDQKQFEYNQRICKHLCSYLKELFFHCNQGLQVDNVNLSIFNVLKTVSCKLIEYADPEDIDGLLNGLKAQNLTHNSSGNLLHTNVIKKLQIIRSNLISYSRYYKVYRDCYYNTLDDRFFSIFSQILVDFVKKVEIDDLKVFTKFIVEKIYKQKSGIIAITCMNDLKYMLRYENKLPEIVDVKMNGDQYFGELESLLMLISALYDCGTVKVSDVDEIFDISINTNLKYLNIFMEIFKQNLNSEVLDFYYETIDSKMRLTNNVKKLKFYKEILKKREGYVKYVRYSRSSQNYRLSVKTKEMKATKEVSEFITVIWKFHNENLLK